MLPTQSSLDHVIGVDALLAGGADAGLYGLPSAVQMRDCEASCDLDLEFDRAQAALCLVVGESNL